MGRQRGRADTEKRREEERKEEPARMTPGNPAEEMPPEVSTNILQIN